MAFIKREPGAVIEPDGWNSDAPIVGIIEWCVNLFGGPSQFLRHALTNEALSCHVMSL